MPKPVISTISAARDEEASVWSGHCDDIPATTDPRWRSTSYIDSASLQITAWRKAEPAVA